MLHSRNPLAREALPHDHGRAQQSGGMMLRRIMAGLAVVLLGGCSWPFGGGSAITNEASAACLRKADEIGLNGVGERQATPGAEGRYTVVLDIKTRIGFSQVTCTYDPAQGAQIEKPKQSSS
jgi:hypothetical protein